MRTALAFVLLAACKPTPTPAPDGGTPAVAAALAVDAAPPPEALDDLLHQTDATVTVSSRVDNPRDYPEHLVDGKPETAWNGKTGDLEGWIEIALPPVATATSIAITAGFDKGARFDENHRIRRLALLRDGKELKEVTLDPDRRTPQPIPIDAPAPGGTYRLAVRETVPGTKKEWRELVVSELVVLGHAGAARVATHMPKVLVAPGSAPAPEVAAPGDASEPTGRTAKSLAAFCATWKADMTRDLASKLPPGEPPDVTCAVELKVPPVEGRAPGWKGYRVARVSWFNGMFSTDMRVLVIEKKDGTILVGPRYGLVTDLGCFGTADLLTIAFAVRGGELMVAEAWITPHAAANPTPEGLLVEDGVTFEQKAKRCAVGTLACGEPVTLTTRELPEAEAQLVRQTPPPPLFP